MSKKPLDEKSFFIIKKEAWNWGTQYTIHDHKMYNLTTAVKKLLALDTLNEDREKTSYPVSYTHLTLPTICSV